MQRQGQGRGALIGPNAILQLIPVLDGRAGRALRDRVMQAAGVAVPAADAGMLPEAQAAAVHGAVRAVLPGQADALLAEAGLAVGDYILAHRIPPLAQGLLRALPAALSARMLARAIARHAWTFAGSGRFRVVALRPVTFDLAGNPLLPGACHDPACHWHRAVFTRLYQRLVWPDAMVTETQCAATGAAACRFVITPGSKVPHGMRRDNAPLA